ncbi:OadG family protein [uncultured Anaerovibrio sp.]|uniref:OadG family protein n=1 Tax=uncultured Anaerovibrio sp. TaxID=361586 RepID=UPI0026164427|nr:OadG family protein [uncultured Anaerovibrio sp.]
MGTQVSNPVVIMLINMTIVFAVLFVLSLYIRLIHKIDPTAEAATRIEPEEDDVDEPALVATKPVVQEGIAGETVAAIAAALASVGVGFSQVKAIRVAPRPGWGNVARSEGLTSLKMRR